MTKFPPTAFALILSAAAGFAATSTAMSPPPSIEDDIQAIPVGGCHSDIRTHDVSERARLARHFHRVSDCDPTPVERSLSPNVRRAE
ncbi:hypothetical protein [Mesorhizobium sp. YR577]|uniref:hypothetical protein n=1 Tax=Mesorhizobium sp. YR577 TaxID=1884373 RepID=UPI0008E90B78|nr:hypothetical protein [Mesorhizobium sp. YR577]SFT86852.1 hypothetical protein SAMN05518861_106255 [Mesorhizobium sp. YR577]